MFSLKFSFLLILNVHYGQQSKQPIIIECGLKYLPNTIGLSTVGDQLYQFIILNETISFIKYSNQYERLQAKSTKQSKNENENDYRHTIDLSDGEYYNFDEIIYSDDEREKILYFLHYEHNQQDYHIRLENLSKNYNSLLLLGNDRHMRFLLYETTFLYNHYIIECDLFRSKSARYIKNYKYQTEMLIISDGESKTIAITNQLNDYLFSIETIFESTEEPMKRLFYFYIDSRQPKQFVSTANVQTIKLSDENYSRKKMKELFAKHQYRYGFIQKFTFTIDDDNDNHQNNNSNKRKKTEEEEEEEDILYLFSNRKKKILYFNINNILSDEITNTNTNIPFHQQDYRDFFYCKNFSTNNTDIFNGNGDDHGDDNGDENGHGDNGHDGKVDVHHDDNKTERPCLKISTTTTTTTTTTFDYSEQESSPPPIIIQIIIKIAVVISIMIAIFLPIIMIIFYQKYYNIIRFYQSKLFTTTTTIKNSLNYKNLKQQLKRKRKHPLKIDRI